MRFFVGLPEPSMAQHFPACFISANRTRRRAGPFAVEDWILDSGGFTEVSTYGGYRSSPREHAAEIRRQAGNGRLLAAVAQDWMCEPHIIKRTGLSVRAHQRLTIERYDELVACDTAGIYVMPVLQGYSPCEYVDHIEAYGDRLAPGVWVGVGSVCKRNASVLSILRVFSLIQEARPDLRLHGFGLKATALAFDPIRDLLHSADSMAWSFSARKQGRDGNDWREAKEWERTLEQTNTGDRQ